MQKGKGAQAGHLTRLFAFFVSRGAIQPRCRSPPPFFDFLFFQKSENGGQQYDNHQLERPLPVVHRGCLCKIAEQECHNLRTGAVRIGGKGCTRSTLGDPFLGSPQDGIIVVRAVCYIGERIILDFHGVHSIVMIWESIS